MLSHIYSNKYLILESFISAHEKPQYHTDTFLKTFVYVY